MMVNASTAGSIRIVHPGVACSRHLKAAILGYNHFVADASIGGRSSGFCAATGRIVRWISSELRERCQELRRGRIVTVYS
jgi:hypothetical protein